MTPPSSAGSGRMFAAGLAAAQCLTGTVMLGWPQPVGRAVGGAPGRAPAGWVVRVLGIRILVQGVILIARPSRAVALASAGIDAVHGLSMLAVAAGGRRYRRAALSSAAAAALSAAASARLARTASREHR